MHTTVLQTKPPTEMGPITLLTKKWIENYQTPFSIFQTTRKRYWLFQPSTLCIYASRLWTHLQNYGVDLFTAMTTFPRI